MGVKLCCDPGRAAGGTWTMRWLLMVLILTLVLAEPIRTLKRRRKGQKDDNEVIVNVSKGRC